MRIIPRFRLGCIIPVALILLVLYLEESLIGFGHAWFASRNFSALEREIKSHGQVRLADMQDDWDKVCLATPYCNAQYMDGVPEAMEKACSTTYNDSFFALAYFRHDRLMHVETLLSIDNITSSKPCLLLSDDPVIGADLYIHPRAVP